MPRITPLRVLLFIPVCYLLLVALFFGLPSPPNTYPGDNDYHQHILRRGDVLTTVHERKPWHLAKGQSIYNRNGFVMKWQLLANNDGDGSIVLSANSQLIANLTEIAMASAPYTYPELIGNACPTGNQDDAPSWFTFADATLLSVAVNHEFDDAICTVTMPNQGIIEVWSAERNMVLPHPPEPVGLSPLITLTNIPIHGDRSRIQDVQVSGMTHQVPTKTFWIRKSLIGIIAPTSMVILVVTSNVLRLFQPLTIIIQGFEIIVTLLYSYCMIVILCWVCCGCPNFREWSRTFPATRFFAPKQRQADRVVWGPSGPILQTNDQLQTPDRTEPQPLTGVRDFFRSRKPLDDLFYTFECTRWLTQPLRQPPDRHEPREDVERSSFKPQIPTIKITAYSSSQT